MSTIKVTNVSHPSAASPAIVLDADGDATYAGVHDFSAATVTGAPQGLVHINTTTFSAVSSVSVNNCFTSAYENYLILGNLTGTVGTPITARLRASGTDATTNYGDQYVQVINTAYTQGSRSAQTLAYIGQVSDSVRSGFTATMYAPQLATQTCWESQTVTSELGRFLNYSSFHTTSSSYDGLTFIVGAGTMSGTIRIYGYKNGA